MFSSHLVPGLNVRRRDEFHKSKTYQVEHTDTKNMANLVDDCFVEYVITHDVWTNLDKPHYRGTCNVRFSARTRQCRSGYADYIFHNATGFIGYGSYLCANVN